MLSVNHHGDVECGHHLRRRQTLSEGRYTGIALFKRLTSKFRLFFDLDFIP